MNNTHPIRIAPSILTADFGHLADQIRLAEAGGADFIHLDVMDGNFVPNITFGPALVETVRQVTTLPLDVHLMVHEPERFLADYVQAGADLLTVHVEACLHLHRTVQAVTELGRRVGVALNPATPVESVPRDPALCGYVAGDERQPWLRQAALHRDEHEQAAPCAPATGGTQSALRTGGGRRH